MLNFKKVKQMYRSTMFEQGKEGFFSIVGGIAGGTAGGFSNWLDIYGNTIMSAIIFATVGGIVGFLISKLMQWLYSCFMKLCNKKKKK